MLSRPSHISRLETAVRRSPVTALVGPRQCGKTTLARLFAQNKETARFDLESESDRRRLQNPELVLGDFDGLIVLDEIQTMPQLFNVMRVLVDRPESVQRFLILGSASPELVKGVSESLAGRVEFVELGGFDLSEVGPEKWMTLWQRGGSPRSFLAESEDDSLAWREGFVQTFLQRDIPQLGITVPAAAMRRFWTMLAHYHGQTWNASELARSMGLSDKTVRGYLDILTGTFMVRQLQPWYANIGKRQVKAPKVYLRDSGLLHGLLGIGDRHTLLAHPRLGASWEGFAIEQILRAFQPPEAYFWATHSGAELDLFFIHRGRRLGFEVKFNEAPRIGRSVKVAMQDLALDHVWVVYPGKECYPVSERIAVLPVGDIFSLASGSISGSKKVLGVK